MSFSASVTVPSRALFLARSLKTVMMQAHNKKCPTKHVGFWLVLVGVTIRGIVGLACSTTAGAGEGERRLAQ